MSDSKEQQGLSSNFNINLKKSIKRNLLYKSILTIIIIGTFKSATIIFDIILSYLVTRNNKQKIFKD